jgi:ABC-type transport system involved in multi-copper enzyme maturation permease subunit
MALLAIINDTYRSLKARGLFWVVFWISIVLVVVFSSFGCNEKGWYGLFGLMSFDSSYMVKGTAWEESMLLGGMSQVITWWVMTFSLLLALFPATTVFPDTMQPGTIDFLLAKPISRLQLFLGKYLGALLIVAVQSSVVVGGMLLALLIRLGKFYPDVLWSIPATVLIFSFIYCFNVLVGILSKSSVAALLWTLLFWGLLWAVQKVELNTGQQSYLDQMKDLGGEAGTKTVEQVHLYSRRVMNVLPKTQETELLFSQRIATKAPYSFPEIMLRATAKSDAEFMTQRSFYDAMDMKQAEASVVRPAWFVVATSLGFEAVVLGLAYLAFRRRDF